MPTYVMLNNFTQQGIQKIKDGPKRVDAARKTFRNMGGEIKAFYALSGQYDTLVLVEAPDDETMARISLAIGALGNIRTQTMRAYTEKEYKKLIAALP